MHDFEVVGALTRSIDDLVLVMKAIQGPDVSDRASCGFTDDESEPEGTSPLSILYIPQFGTNQVEPEIVAACAVAARNLAAMGHAIEEGEAPFDLQLFERFWPKITAAGMAWLLHDENWEGKIGENFATMVAQGQAMTAVDYIDLLAAFREIAAQIARCFNRYDIIMTPSAGAMPWRADQFGPPYHQAFTPFVNAAGTPAIALPTDPSPQGIPIGFQLVAPFGADWRLIALGRAYEQRYPWVDRWPPPFRI